MSDSRTPASSYPAKREVTEGVILVRNGTIVAVQPSLPADFQGTRVDLEGRWVIPGLVDMHTHSFGNGSPAGAPQVMGPEGVARVDLYAGVVAFLDLFSQEDSILGFRDLQRDAADEPTGPRDHPPTAP